MTLQTSELQAKNMSRLFPKLEGRKEYSFEVDGLMTAEQLSQWIKDLEVGHGRPGSLRWLADSYRALLRPDEQLSLFVSTEEEQD